MEAIFLPCGAGGPQLKRNPLYSAHEVTFLNADPHDTVQQGRMEDLLSRSQVQRAWRVSDVMERQPRHRE
jgi:hypothetical protein